jgi:dynein heavy chain, axonemal
LITIIDDTLHGVRLAIRGLAVMSKELEECFNSIIKGVIPDVWRSKSYPSLKPLGSYIARCDGDYDQSEFCRLNFFQKWIDDGPPTTFWFSGFFFTQSFLTGVLQNYSRKYKIPIDQLHFEFELTEFESDVSSGPEFGVYCKVR